MPRPRAERPTFSLAIRGGRYYVQWWEAGRACRVSCRTSVVAEAKRFLAEFKAARDTPQPPPAPTVGAILDGYQAERKGHVHSNTIEYDCVSLKRQLADLPVDLLANEQISIYIAARRRNGAGGAAARHRKSPRPLSDGTLIRELGTLRAALAWAVRKKWIAAAPYVERPEAPPARDRWLTRQEADKLLAAAHTLHVRLFIALALYTAARAGALLSLTWAQVDLRHERIVLGRGRGRKRRATVPIIPELRLELERAIEVATCEHVIEHGGKPVGSIKTGFRAAVRRAELVGVTPHALRHTAATWMVQSGVPLAMVAAYLGNSVEMVERVYGHHSPEWLRQGAVALSRQLAEETI